MTTRSVVDTISPFSRVCWVKSMVGMVILDLLVIAAMALAVWVVGEAMMLCAGN